MSAVTYSTWYDLGDGFSVHFSLERLQGPQAKRLLVGYGAARAQFIKSLGTPALVVGL